MYRGLKLLGERSGTYRVCVLSVVDISSDGPFLSGWGPLEHGRGVSFRWVSADSAQLAVTVPHPWHAVKLWHRFADAVHHDVLLTVDDGADEPASGMLRWLGRGLRTQRVELDRPIEPGRVEMTFWPVQTCQSALGGPRLSVAIAGVLPQEGRAASSGEGTRWLVGHR